ncbi:MAG: choice-of-anchor D domain-containing protein [Proteobacteria bacterium]|nr:choice-of-anchor D domain-containing protein [Pseudomonadota bacterium]
MKAGVHTLSLIVSNTAERTAVLSTISTEALGLAEPMSLTGGSCTSEAWLSANESCTLTLKFSPTAAGAAQATLQLAYHSDGIDEQLTASKPLTGTGIASTVSPAVLTLTAEASLLVPQLLSDTVATWSSVITNSSPTDQSIVVKNTGGSTATFKNLVSDSGITGLSGIFSVVASGTTCSTSLEPDASCILKARYRPTAAGTATQTATLTYHDAVTEQNVSGVLSGTAISPANLVFSANGSCEAFGPVFVADVTCNMSLSLSNSGQASATLATLSTSSLGLNGTKFSYVSSTCAATLAASATCTIQILFTTPDDTNEDRTQTLSLSYNDGSSDGHTASVSLRGYYTVP